MDLAAGKDEAVDLARGAQPQDGAEVGAAAGVNIVPGSDDDGWVVPEPVLLDDSTVIQLYKDGEALHAAYNAIANAQRRICLEVYIFASDDTGKAFSKLLCQKAEQGVKVYVIYDDIGSIGTESAMLENMRRSGIHLRSFHPVRPWACRFSWRPFNRDHRKLLVIDDDIAGMGGLNIGREYAGSWVIGQRDAKATDFWRDNAIGLRGPSARYLLRSFGKTWHYVNHGGRIHTAEFNYNTESLGVPSKHNELSVLASVPTRSSPLRRILRTLFANATKSIQMTMAYFAPDDDLINELCKAATRGVKVQLMLPARTDVHLLTIAARSFYEKLMTAGVEVYERQAVVLHAKTMTIDGCTTVIGSTNLDYRSIEYNLELSSIIRSKEFGRNMHALFKNDICFAKRINLNEWRKRAWTDRLIQWTVSRARYLL